MNPYQYIININKTSCTDAQKALQKAMIELNQHMEIYNVSVKELCNQAHVARSTFYFYYENVMQLKEEIENNLLYDLIQINDNLSYIKVDGKTDFPFFQNTCKFIEQNKQVFYAFLIANPNVQFIQKWKDGIKYHFWECLFDGQKIKNENLILEIISTEAITAFTYWLNNPYDIDMTHLNLLIVQTLEILK